MSQRNKRQLGLFLLLFGCLVGTYVLWTATFGEPLSGLQTRRAQSQLSHQLAQATVSGNDSQRQLKKVNLKLVIQNRSQRWANQLKPGDAAARITVPKIDVDLIAIAGDRSTDLKRGPGFYPDFDLPGGGPTTAIAGHRTTYSAPFRNINQLKVGDLIKLELPYARFTYSVYDSRSVLPQDLSVLSTKTFSQLVLTACDPPFSAERRLAVMAKEVSVELK